MWSVELYFHTPHSTLHTLLLIVLRISAPGAPSVGVLLACLQADELPVCRSHIDIAQCESGLESHRLSGRVQKSDLAVFLVDREKMALSGAEVHILSAKRG